MAPKHSIQPENEPKAASPPKPRVRGKNMTARKRAAEFQDDMEVRDDKMWCKHCGTVVKFEEKIYAVRHVGSANQKR